MENKKDIKDANVEIELDFEIPDSGDAWTPYQLSQFDAQMRSGRIDKNILRKLLVELRNNRKQYGDDYHVSEALGYVFNVVIDKNLGNGKWRGYTPDWKEEMRDRALELLIRHSHNFDPMKMQKSKNVDPYYYLAKITFCAFIQAKEKLAKRSKKIKFVQLNEAVMSNYSSIEDYAIVANNEIDEQEKLEKENSSNVVNDKQGDDVDLSNMSEAEMVTELADDDYVNG